MSVVADSGPLHYLVLLDHATSGLAPSGINRRQRNIKMIRAGRGCERVYASGKWASLPEAHTGLLGGFSQGSILTAQHEFSSLGQLEVGGVIDRQLVNGSQL